ncbi:hypothetical protein [Lacihabitans sp. LS3-19]|uniref:hypothetical protein n=1 Tax=Lacihabitans sp. LS3-19 TaxID=2487335 RepID=UPI0020CE07E8|nr:hypothetical protein [Lacihabitans sp. LS3-19]
MIQISLVTFLAIFLVGSPVIEYIEHFQEENSDIGFVFEQRGDQLLIKVPFNLPYHYETVFEVNPSELVVFKGDFYRAVNKAFVNDTVFTGYKRENLTRQNVFELMGSVAQNFDNDADPLKSLERVIKSFAKQYYTQQIIQYTYFWNETPTVSHYFMSQNHETSFSFLLSPPPQIS